jgi:signal transduction histidine kinase
MSQQPKIFNRATIKLTLIYTVILMIISVCFSVAVGLTASREIDRPFPRPPREIIFEDSSRVDFTQIFRERNRETNGRIIVALILVNLGVLILGAGFSLILARWTLKPIEKAMAEESQFVSDASHELRTPLAVITTENEVILRDKDISRKDLRDQVQSNLNEARQLQKLTNYLLDLSSSENCEVKITQTEFDLTEIIESAISRVSANAKVKKIDFSREIQPVKITASFEALCEILVIILDNAVKYSTEKSVIKVVANEREISILDNGGGISDEDLPHVFDRFYRAEKSRTSEGFGLGLSLARNLAEKISAKISVENLRENDKITGAKFIVKF